MEGFYRRQNALNVNKTPIFCNALLKTNLSDQQSAFSHQLSAVSFQPF